MYNKNKLDNKIFVKNLKSYQKMSLENFLIQIKPDVSEQAVKTIIYKIQKIGGKVNIIARQGRVIIAYFDNIYKDKIKKLPFVKIVGGITINKREIKGIHIKKY